MVAVLFAVCVLVFLIFIVIPSGDPAQRIAGKNADPGEHREHPQELGLRQAASTSST